ncbi:putative mediator of RNA polymerase II transcription subunit 12 [Drosophila subpulchrella]|uniref:putative mediator of RNA polymerase II transcription subunit 12 n=1 Tax=Drosophila subpulchrella TaxID=1486046 RepID=UPI0018A1B2A3|nr:putative mediator of RNA polymerase II transcription subunit 12 [Drosophila subpulchrella]
MRLALILGTLSAFLCLASGLSQSEASGSKGNGFPKKVTTLKKRPTKTPTTAPISTSRGTTLKPSKPRVKIAKSAATRNPTKAPAVAETFANLPADDLEFIKELDKQFKLHGDKIKIKVERDNSTGSGGKNSKRTIEGDLGYGYSHPGYDYTPPKFMFYPYSQHDIPTGFAHRQPLPEEQEPEPEQAEPQQPAVHHHSHNHEQVTSVTIEPSYSYELKPQTSYETQPQHTAPEQPQIDLPQEEAEGASHASAGYQEPVIVLRIPGPAKYAAHLQTLLQQYLEIRAAQYLSLLQEAEQNQQQQHQHQHQHQQQHADPPQQYGPPEPATYHQEVTYAHQLAPTPAPVQYAPIDDVYQSYKGRHQQQLQLQQQQYEPQQYYAPMDYQQPTQFYYAQPQSHLQQQPQLYLIAMTQPEPEAEPQQHQHIHQHQQQQQQQHHHHQQQHQQPIYVPESDPPTAPGVPEQEPEPEHSLPITENNPRPTHTKVIFNPYPYQQQHEQHQQQQADDEEQHSEGERPFNYHAHSLKMRQGKRAAKPEPAAEDGASGSGSGDHRLQQIREYVREKLGAEMGSAVEYKTTQLLEG